jgi:hypothetical protein
VLEIDNIHVSAWQYNRKAADSNEVGGGKRVLSFHEGAGVMIYVMAKALNRPTHAPNQR